MKTRYDGEGFCEFLVGADEIRMHHGGPPPTGVMAVLAFAVNERSSPAVVGFACFAFVVFHYRDFWLCRSPKAEQGVTSTHAIALGTIMINATCAAG